MVCVNELNDFDYHKREILEPLAVMISPYAPHIAEELWHQLGHSASVTKALFPKLEEKYLKEDTITYPVSFNGKMRFKIDLPADISKEDAEKKVLNHEKSAKWLEGKTPRKVIFVPRKIINVVV